MRVSLLIAIIGLSCLAQAGPTTSPGSEVAPLPSISDEVLEASSPTHKPLDVVEGDAVDDGANATAPSSSPLVARGRFPRRVIHDEFFDELPGSSFDLEPVWVYSRRYYVFQVVANTMVLAVESDSFDADGKNPESGVWLEPFGRKHHYFPFIPRRDGFVIFGVSFEARNASGIVAVFTEPGRAPRPPPPDSDAVPTEAATPSPAQGSRRRPGSMLEAGSRRQRPWPGS